MYVSPPNGGQVNVSGVILSSFPTRRTYQTGTYVFVEAIPAPGYRFVRWSGDIDGITKSITVQIDRSKWIQAVYTRIVPNWLIAIIIVAITVPLFLRWRKRHSKYTAQTSPQDSGAL